MSVPAAPTLLALVDIDGTLLLDDAYAHGRAMVEALRDVHAAELPDDVVMRVGPWGKTDTQIARKALRAAGVAETAIDARRDEWVARAAERFAALARAEDWTLRPGLAAGLERLADGGVVLAPLTGNLRAIAATKLELMGVAHLFALERGAYGDDAEQRALLPAVARGRAGDWPRERAWIVGDTEATSSPRARTPSAAHSLPPSGFQTGSRRPPTAVVADFDAQVELAAADGVSLAMRATRSWRLSGMRQIKDHGADAAPARTAISLPSGRCRQTEGGEHEALGRPAARRAGGARRGRPACR